MNVSFNRDKQFRFKHSSDRNKATSFTNRLNQNLSYNKLHLNYLDTPFSYKLQKNNKNKPIRRQEPLVKKTDPLITGTLLLAALSKHDYEENNFGFLSQDLASDETIDRYGQKIFALTDVPPPNQKIIQFYNTNYVKTSPSFYGLSNQEAKNALIKYVSNNYCTSTSLAKRMHIVKIENSNLFTYTLETFSEKRQTCWAYESYNGGYIDNSSTGKSPPVWDIVPYYEPQPFKDHVETMIIPHSECIRNCHSCKSNGRKQCVSCNGNGYDKCYVCHGEGYKTFSYAKNETERCLLCNGNGYRKCYTCNGKGVQKCKVCAGTGQLKCYLKLTITWRNHIDDFLPENICIPKERLKFATGDIVFNDTNPQVFPINQFTNPELNLASEKLINKHKELYLKLEKPVMQRQLIHVIQISTIHYRYRNKLGIFWIYGKELKVYAPDYSKNCCTCCNMF